MFVLISIVAVWIVALQEVSGDCNEICLQLETDSTFVPHRSDCVCLQANYGTYNLNPPWHENVDLSAIFYEPAEGQSMQKLLSLETPFSIHNPYYLIKRVQTSNEDITNNHIEVRSLHSKRNIDTSAIDDKVNDELLENDNDLRKFPKPKILVSKSGLASNINPTPKKTKTKESLTEDTEKLPIYIDIDVQQSDTSFQSIEFSEKYMRDCIDLHILLFLRKCKNFDGIKNMWESEDVKQYMNYSDTQLKEIIDMKCSKLSSVVTTSLDEIKQTWPKKLIDDNQHPIFKENVTSLLQKPIQSLKVSKLEHKTFKDEIEIAPSQNNVLLGKTPSAESKFLRHPNLQALKTTANHPAFVITTMLPDLIQNNISEKPNANENISEARQHDLQESIRINKIDTLTIRPYNVITSNSRGLSTLEITTEQNTFPTTLIKFKKYNTNETDLNNDSTIQETTVQTQSQPEKIETRLTNDSGLSDLLLVDPTATTKDGNEQPITTVPHANNTARTEYKQSEIKIQKIVTKELNNDTVISIIDGYEAISGDYPDTTENIVLREFSTQKTYEEDQKASTKSNVLSAFTDSKNEITGKLYFLFNDIKVPAQFVQEPDGQLRMGIDGNSLCNQLKNNYASVLLAALCLRKTESRSSA